MDPRGTSPLDQISRPVKLHSITSVLIATALGAPIAGCIVMGINYLRLGMSSRAWLTMLAGLGVTGGLLWLAFVIPDSWHVLNTAFIGIQLGGMYAMARSLQGKLIEQHTASGGSMVTKWRTAGIGLLTGIVLLLAVIAVVFLTSGPKGTRLAVGTSAIYYSDGATKDNAETLGAALKTVGFLADGHPITVCLGRDSKGFVVSFAIDDEALNISDIENQFMAVGKVLSAEGMGKPLTIWLCDESMTRKEKIVVE